MLDATISLAAFRPAAIVTFRAHREHMSCVNVIDSTFYVNTDIAPIANS